MGIFRKILILIFFLSLGAIFFLFKKDLIIIKIPNLFDSQIGLGTAKKGNESLRKKVKLYYFKEDKFLTQELTLVWFADKASNIKNLVNNWLTLLLEERILEKKVTLDSCCLADFEQLAYLSFNQNFLEKDWSTFLKWQLIESLLKTLKNAELDLRFVSFLIKNEIMQDDHLDFSQSWLIDGFLDT